MFAITFSTMEYIYALYFFLCLEIILIGFVCTCIKLKSQSIFKSQTTRYGIMRMFGFKIKNVIIQSTNPLENI